MKITLERKLQLKSAIVYLNILREIQHDEIKEYLNSRISFQNEIVEKRIRNYLCEKGIYNKYGELTDYGKNVMENGMIEEIEEGKYQIWYTQNDPLFDNSIFYFKRIKPEINSQRMIPFEPNFSDKKFRSLPISGEYGQSSLEFSIVGTANLGEEKADTSINCTWIWNNLDNSLFLFSGEFVTNSFNKDNKQLMPLTDYIDNKNHVDFKMDLKQCISNIIPNWNAKTERYRFKIEYIKDEDVYKYFEYSGKSLLDGYDSCVYDKLPIEPYNDIEARQWRNHLLDIELLEDYIHPKDFESTVTTLNQKKGFEAYKTTLDNLTAEKYREEISPSKVSARDSVYWHLSAPMDLNPSIPKEMITGQPFSLPPEDKISFHEISKKIHRNRNFDKIFYYDKYVNDEWKQRKLCAFFSAFSYQSAYLITDITNNNRSDYIEKHSNIIRKNLKDIFKIKSKIEIPHHRCLILSTGNELESWIIDDSLDYIRFDENVISADTIGEITRSVIFSNVKIDILHSELRHFIEGEIKNA
jgi:hypothetical protein